MVIKIAHLIEATEAAFLLDRQETDWLDGALRASSPWLGPSNNWVAFIFDAPSQHKIQLAAQVSTCVPDITSIVLNISSRLLHKTSLYSSPVRAVQLLLSEHAAWVPRLWDKLLKRGSKEALFLWSINPHGPIIGICSLLPQGIAHPQLKLSPKAFRTWEQISGFFDAGLRLHRALRKKLVWNQRQGMTVEFPWQKSLADNRCTPQDIFRALVLHLEQKNKGRLVQGEEEAKTFYQALVTGEWSIVDTFAVRKRHYAIARWNDPEQRDPRGLTEIEYQVALRTARGYPNKTIAYELDLPTSTVATHLANIQLKRGTNSRLDLVDSIKHLVASIDLYVFWLKIADDHYVVLSYQRRKLRHLSQLAPGTLDVLHYVLQGKSNLEIARLRGTSPRTVANQVAALFRKYNVSSRAELVARLTSNRSTLRRYPSF